nr:MAG TPA: hyaluronidase [Caudoviricetes sp.]
MTNKTFNTRIKNKRDTSANWTSKDPVLLNGELIIVDTASGETRFKIGDGTKKYSQLPFQDEILRNSKVDLDAGVYTATASSTDGIAYTATVPGITALTAGASFIMIPNKASTSKAPTLNVNVLGAKPIRRRLSSLTTSLQQGYSTNWIALNKPFTVVYDGTAWVVEGLTKTDGADVYGAVAQATADANGNNIAETYATIVMLQSMLPKVTTITLTSNWVGDASPYYQDIALSCVTETSIVDLQPTPEQLNSWQDDGIAFTTLSGNGTVRVYVAGGKPSSAISVQVRVQEVTVI